MGLSSRIFEIQAFLCFIFLKKKFENSKWSPFLASEIFIETWEGLVFTDILWVKNLAEIALSHAVFEIQACLCFAILAENSKWLPFLRDKIFFEIALSSTVFEIQAFLKKIRKIQNGRHFWRVKYSLKLGKASLHRYPVGQKFCRNPTSKFLFYEENGLKSAHISLVLFYMCTLRAYISNFVFCIFFSKIRELNMTPILGGENFWKIGESSLFTYPGGSKISTKSLYLTRLRRYKQFCVLLVKKIVNA